MQICYVNFHFMMNQIQQKQQKPFRKYVRSYSIEIMKDKNGNINNSLIQLKASKPVIKDLLKDFLIETKGFKYQLTMKVFLRKQKKKKKKQ